MIISELSKQAASISSREGTPCGCAYDWDSEQYDSFQSHFQQGDIVLLERRI
jgi:hypothetical protein